MLELFASMFAYMNAMFDYIVFLGVTNSLSKFSRALLSSSTDEDINTIVTPTTPTAIHTGPITRVRARQLNYQVLSFLGNDSN